MPRKPTYFFLLGDALGYVLSETTGSPIITLLIKLWGAPFMYMAPVICLRDAPQAIVKLVWLPQTHFCPTVDHRISIFAVDARQQVRFRQWQLFSAKNVKALLGGSDDSAVAIHVPVTELGNFLRMNQCCFAIYQILESDGRTQQVTQAMAFVLKPPGWSPDGRGETTEDMRGARALPADSSTSGFVRSGS